MQLTVWSSIDDYDRLIQLADFLGLPQRLCTVDERIADVLSRTPDPSPEFLKNVFGLLAVVAESVDRIIGYCGISLQEVDGSLIPEIGYRFHPDFWGQGYATEAARGYVDLLIYSSIMSQRKL
jgi:RimJ/RimL family protein N-acetyltransferase